MLRVVDFGEKFNNPVVVCLGNYESLHLGHANIISRAGSLAESFGAEVMLMTVDEGENVRNTGVILTFPQRLERAERLGVSSVLRVRFDEGFKNLSPNQFLNVLFSTLNVKGFACGFDFRFGHQRAGDTLLLNEVATSRGIPVIVAEKVTYGGQKIATTAVKAFVQNGDVTAANAMLGYRFFIEGVVEKGRMQGREMGFPTANVGMEKGKCAVKNGVYATKIKIDGVEYGGITNVGSAPTFDFDSEKIETYIKGYTGDLYGKTVRVELERRLRDIKRFSCIDELKAQLARDVESI